MEEKGKGAIRIVEIREEPIELYKMMKLGDLAGSGGEAKAMIAEGMVWVNGAVETRKRKKIVSGDVIEQDGERIQVQVGKPGK